MSNKAIYQYENNQGHAFSGELQFDDTQPDGYFDIPQGVADALSKQLGCMVEVEDSFSNLAFDIVIFLKAEGLSGITAMVNAEQI